MTRVVHVIIGLGRGGAERALSRLLDAQKNNSEYRHAVISLTDEGCYGEEIRYMGIPVFTMGMNKSADIPAVFLKLIRKLRELKPDIVQTWMYHADLLGGLAAKLAGSPAVLWGIRTVDLGLGANPSTRIVRKLCALMSGWLPSSILCVAEAARRSHSAFGYAYKKMQIVPNGFEIAEHSISDSDLQALRSLCGSHDELLIVGCVGRFHPDKDHRNFVEAAGLVTTRFPNARFMMVGPGLDESNVELASWINAGNLSDKFVLLGERNDIPLCLSAMDIFCSPSRTEAFPQVVGEAMSLSRPSVVTDVGDTSHVVGETAIVVEPENSEALAEGISTLLSASSEERKAIGANAQSRVQREFSIQRTVELTLNAYSRALDKKLV